MSRRLALLISNNQYSDANLTKLAAPVADAEALARVLRDPAIGAFDEVQTLINQPSADVRHAIAGFFHGKQPNDLLLLYFSGHGLLDDRSRLYLATPDTDAQLPRARSVEAAYLAQEMEDSRSKRQVLILDCCHSGAFRQGITKSSVGQPVQTGAIFDGDGRVVLAASDATQYAFEGDKLLGDRIRSLFTHYLVEGLEGLRADTNHDGVVTVDELYEYLYSRVTAHKRAQTPVKWNYKQRGIFVLAGQGTSAVAASTSRSTNGKPKAPTYRTWVVDQMYRGNFTTINEAIDAAKAGDKIIIHPGHYEESLVINKPLELVGKGNRDTVVIEATGQHTILFDTVIGRVYNLTLRQNGGGQWYCVDIAQGRLLLEECDISSQSLANIAIHSGANPTVRNNSIHDGKEVGIFVYEQGQGVIEGNDIFANALCNITIYSGGNPIVYNNQVHHSKQSGILVQDQGQGMIERNDIFANAHAGIEISGGSNPTVYNNRIHDNGKEGISVYIQGLGTIEKNDIFANHSDGIVIKSGGNPVVRNNHIHDHHRYYYNSYGINGIYVDDLGQGVIEMNDIYANSYAGIGINSGGNPSVHNNRINKNVFAISISFKGGGHFESNDLRGNKGGSWSIFLNDLHNVSRQGNMESSAYLSYKLRNLWHDLWYDFLCIIGLRRHS